MIKKSAYLFLFLMLSVMTLSWISMTHFNDSGKPAISAEQREQIHAFVKGEQRMHAGRNLPGQ